MEETVLQDTPTAAAEPQPFSYVTFTEPDGLLDGCYYQVPPPEHLGCMIAVSDAVAMNWLAYRANAARDGVELLPPVVTPPPPESVVVAGYMAAVQKKLDATAVSYGYDSVLSVITYADEPAVARYQTEGQAFRRWRSLCWAHCESVLAAVKAGTQAAPTYDELVDGLPDLDLPPSTVQN